MEVGRDHDIKAESKERKKGAIVGRHPPLEFMSLLSPLECSHNFSL